MCQIYFLDGHCVRPQDMMHTDRIARQGLAARRFRYLQELFRKPYLTVVQTKKKRR